MARYRRRRKNRMYRTDGVCVVPRSCRTVISAKGGKRMAACIRRTMRRLHVAGTTAINICRTGTARGLRTAGRYCTTCGRKFRRGRRRYTRRVQTVLGRYPGYA